ncbi:glucan biosynthesis protein [Halopseudomonas aestusnigri]|uniref:Glucans biosynthesis protein n=1 Tax=Halopseudomonas aestusnigri TaxID=857252 RepID=A0AAQ1G429_9GAMM|nr:glucan biosynthesis protein G [Halopseudomonas aestusnigri]OWL90900.1 glucan biosynthesis protein G [Halopseudomonas aestusnigri]SEF49758.1 glucans biosynthesis protein [Halopseudomonas aestusnigri]
MLRGTILISAASCLCVPLNLPAADFSFEQVITQARERAANAYQPPKEVPRFLQELSFDDYQGIRFKPENSLWHDSDSAFRVMPVPTGLFYRRPVQMHIVDEQGTEPLTFAKSQFTYPNTEVERLVPADLGYAGFKLTFPLKGEDQQNQFLVFAGASYFRAVGRDNNFGISGRGLAIDTGMPGGEEFPDFVEFWLERPAPDATSMTFYGLLDSPSMSGAYRFVVTPGETTALAVESVLFPRKDVELLGIAPLTSMFYYGENSIRPRGEWRPEVHDSDGLLIHDGGTGEWFWRPLRNPSTLRMDYFSVQNLRGFGLLQRDTDFRSYQDPEAIYDGRPSSWVETDGNWGSGKVVLVQIPTANETNDNIVAFWQPSDPVQHGKPIQRRYRVLFGDQTIAASPLGSAQETFVGDGTRVGGGNQEGALRLIVDFAGGPLDALDENAAVLGEVQMQHDGELLEQFVQYLPALKRWRLSMLVRPAADQSLALRAYLHSAEHTLSETWQYEIPAGNDMTTAE